MSILAKKYFRDEASAFHHLEGLLWAAQLPALPYPKRPNANADLFILI